MVYVLSAPLYYFEMHLYIFCDLFDVLTISKARSVSHNEQSVAYQVKLLLVTSQYANNWLFLEVNSLPFHHFYIFNYSLSNLIVVLVTSNSFLLAFNCKNLGFRLTHGQRTCG